MNLFYAPKLTNESVEYVFDKDESRHISKVLRKNIGDKLFLTDGKGNLYTANIRDNHPKKTQVEIVQIEKKANENYKIHIAIAPTKSNDRIEWFLEKATEMGIDEVSLILTEHSERKKINWERYHKIIVSAMKQSLQTYKPILNPLMKWQQFIEQDFNNYQKTIAYCKSDNLLIDSIEKNKNIVLLIGPEGGFSENEMLDAITHNFIPVGLSNNRLRTETAGIVAVMSVHLFNKKK